MHFYFVSRFGDFFFAVVQHSSIISRRSWKILLPPIHYIRCFWENFRFTLRIFLDLISRSNFSYKWIFLNAKGIHSHLSLKKFFSPTFLGLLAFPGIVENFSAAFFLTHTRSSCIRHRDDRQLFFSARDPTLRFPAAKLPSHHVIPSEYHFFFTASSSFFYLPAFSSLRRENVKLRFNAHEYYRDTQRAVNVFQNCHEKNSIPSKFPPR